jgi:phage-related protein
LTFGPKSLIKKAEGEPLPPVRVVFYQEEDGAVPVMAWLEALRSQPKHRAKCIKWLILLKEHGHDLRRPKADFLRNGIHELRVKFSFENYRLLYFFHGGDTAVVTHGITKHTDQVSPEDIDKALQLKKIYESDPESHAFYWEGN